MAHRPQSVLGSSISRTEWKWPTFCHLHWGILELCSEPGAPGCSGKTCPDNSQPHLDFSLSLLFCRNQSKLCLLNNICTFHLGIQDLGRKPRSSLSAHYYSLKSMPGRQPTCLQPFPTSAFPTSFHLCLCSTLIRPDPTSHHPLSFALALKTASYRLQGFYPCGVPQSHVCRRPWFRFCSHLDQSLQTAPEQIVWVNSSVRKPRTPSIPRSLHAAQPASGSPGTASSPVYLQPGRFSFHLHFFHLIQAFISPDLGRLPASFYIATRRIFGA